MTQAIVHLGAAPNALDPISAAVSVGFMAFSAWLSRRGPQQKVASTAIVNELEPVLKQNLDAYLAGPRTSSRQALHLAQFDMAWHYLKSQEGCGNPELGKPGQNCIADRSRGGQWDWASYYRDPIANDPQLKPDPEIPTATPSEQVSVLGFGQELVLLAAIAALLLVVN